MKISATPLGVLSGAQNVLSQLAPKLVPAEIPVHVADAVALLREFSRAAKALHDEVKDDPKYADAAKRLNDAGIACDTMKIEVPEEVLATLAVDSLIASLTGGK